MIRHFAVLISHIELYVRIINDFKNEKLVANYKFSKKGGEIMGHL